MNSFMHAMTRESQLPIITFMRQGTSQEWEGMSGFCCQRRYTQFPFMATNTSISDIYDQSKTQRRATFGTKQGAANHQSLPWPLTSSLDIIQTHSWHEWEKNCMYPNVFFPQGWIDPPLWQHNEVEKIVSGEYVTDESCGGKQSKIGSALPRSSSPPGLSYLCNVNASRS